MATASHTSTAKSSSARKSTATRKTSQARSKDAIAVLKEQHQAVKKLFGQFTKAKGESRQQSLASRICMELKVHTQIEEELLYPQAHEEIDDPELVDESLVEHNAAKDLIRQIEQTDPSDEMFAAKMQVLQEQIEHHVKEEEDDLFPKAKKADLDMKALGERLAMRKKQLMRERQGDGMEIH